jgi:hypothetical protein
LHFQLARSIQKLPALPIESLGRFSGTEARMETRDTVTEDLIAERRLWTAVVVNAVDDWRTGTLRARREAQQFLFENTHDFELVCAGAGLDPSDMRSRLLKIGRMVDFDSAMGNPLLA